MLLQTVNLKNILNIFLSGRNKWMALSLKYQIEFLLLAFL
jgi:hypothetical protein